MKERRLISKNADLKRSETLLRQGKEENDAADLGDEEKIRVIQARIRTRENRERLEREKSEREKKTKIWRQQQEQREKREREAAEALAKQRAEERAVEQARQEEETKKLQKIINDEARRYREQYIHPDLPRGSTRQAYSSTCRHDGWWPKVQGRTACPECDDIWTYLLQCPGCKMKACPRCQAVRRGATWRSAPRTNRKAPSPVRIPSPDFSYDYW